MNTYVARKESRVGRSEQRLAVILHSSYREQFRAIRRLDGRSSAEKSRVELSAMYFVCDYLDTRRRGDCSGESEPGMRRQVGRSVACGRVVLAVMMAIETRVFCRRGSSERGGMLYEILAVYDELTLLSSTLHTRTQTQEAGRAVIAPPSIISEVAPFSFCADQLGLSIVRSRVANPWNTRYEYVCTSLCTYVLSGLHKCLHTYSAPQKPSSNSCKPHSKPS
jgi:hypothetical protein